jgi:uncharacterized DUF497 family protein
MRIVYLNHAKDRMKQRGITELDVEHILEHPDYVKKSIKKRKEAVGVSKNRTIKIIFIEKENYIKIITVI